MDGVGREGCYVCMYIDYWFHGKVEGFLENV